MKVVLNPQFDFLKDFVLSIPNYFTTSGEILYQGRNELRVYQVAGVQVNVKKYKIPILLNRIVYSFFRATKAERAYQNALRLLEKGFETPAPIAYVEKKRGGLFAEGYFVSVQCSYPYNFRRFETEQLAGNEAFFARFARFTASLHDSQILHLDYSPGNILFDQITGDARFSLLDINRMQFCPVDEDLGCRSFERLWGTDEMFQFMAAQYAQARGFDDAVCIRKVMRYHQASVQYFANKAIIKQKRKQKDFIGCIPLWLENLKYLYFSAG